MLLHYYGDIVRRLFLGGGLAMLLSLPIFNKLLPVPHVISLAAITILAVVAGFMSPEQRWVRTMTVIIASLGIIVFGYESTVTYALSHEGGSLQLLFWINIGLAVNFLFALYYATKTLRSELEHKH